MRRIWKGSVSFGMVTIPVGLYPATEQREVSFHQVHAEDGCRIQYRRVCSGDGHEVPYSDIAKGYETPAGDVVVLTKEDMEDLPLATARRIEVLHFVTAGQIDEILVNKSYYLEPEAAGMRAYALLRDSLAASGRVGVAKVALRQRESLSVLRARGRVLELETLLWPDEVREPDFEVLDDEVPVNRRELARAASLIDAMTDDFDPAAHRDAYREAIEAVVAAKIEGGEVVRPVTAELPAGGPVADLEAALSASVAAAKARRKAAVPVSLDAARARKRPGSARSAEPA